MYVTDAGESSSIERDTPRTLNEVTPVILAGGLGTRLRSALPDCPKVLAPVQGRPFITFLLDQLSAAGVDEVVLLTGHRSDLVFEALGKSYRGMTLNYSTETQPLGTGGALRAALPFLNRPYVLLMNGDSYCAVSFPEFVSFHGEKKADVSMVLKRVAKSERFGQVVSLPCGRITKFREKEPGAEAAWINAGVYLLPRTLVQDIPNEGVVSLEKDFLPGWIHEKVVCGYRSPGLFLDIGTPGSYALAGTFFSHLGLDAPVVAAPSSSHASVE